MMFPTPNYENLEAYKPIIKVYQIQIKRLMAWIRIISMEKYFLNEILLLLFSH